MDTQQKRQLHWLWQLLTFAVLVIFDQGTKYVAREMLVLGEPVSVLPGIFNLTLVYNPGAAFGMFGDYPDWLRRITLWGVSGVALLVVFRFMIKEAKDDRISQYALVGILSGALGNIIDRVRFDAVVDFLDFYWKTYHWPAFNIADSAISLGVAVLMFRVTFIKHPSEVAGGASVTTDDRKASSPNG